MELWAKKVCLVAVIMKLNAFKLIVGHVPNGLDSFRLGAEEEVQNGINEAMKEIRGTNWFPVFV